MCRAYIHPLQNLTIFTQKTPTQNLVQHTLKKSPKCYNANEK